MDWRERRRSRRVLCEGGSAFLFRWIGPEIASNLLECSTSRELFRGPRRADDIGRRIGGLGSGPLGPINWAWSTSFFDTWFDLYPLSGCVILTLDDVTSIILFINHSPAQQFDTSEKPN